VALLGLDPSTQLRPVLGVDGRPLALPEEGLVLSPSLADALGARVGDAVELEVLERPRVAVTAVVRALSQDYAGRAAYAGYPLLARWLDEAGVASGAFLRIDPRMADEVQARLRDSPNVGAVVDRRTGLRAFQETIAENLLRMMVVNVIFAGILAAGVVYNTARVSLAERGRELATLRVLGFTRGEISRILLGELALLTLVALPVGLLLGRVFAGWAAEMFETQDYRFPLVIEPRTYGFAAVVTAAAALLSALWVRRNLDRLDLIAVLKARE
jgi:putative ABC transport system permease protein